MYIIFGVILLILIAIFSFRGDIVHEMEEREKPTVAASFFPLAEIARQVGGDSVQVRQIVAGSANIHDFEPAPSDLNKIKSADLFIYNGYELDPWAEKLTEELEEEQVRYIEAATFVEGIEHEGDHSHEEEAEGAETADAFAQDQEMTEEPHAEEDHGHDHDHGEFDPHLWLSIENMVVLTYAMRDELISIHPEMAQEYSDNADRYVTLLRELDKSYDEGLASCQLREAIVSHDAYTYLGQEYNITFYSIAGLSPQDESSSQELAELTLMANDKGIEYVFAEPQASDKQVQTIADEIGAEVLMLNPAAGRTETQQDEGKTYTQIMQDNLKQLKTGLQCSS